jgi:elongation factor G
MIVPNMVDGKMKGFVKVAYGVLRDWERNEYPIPDYLKEAYMEARLTVSEAAAENDEALMEKFFDTGALSPEEIEAGVKIGINTCSTITVLGGSAYKNHGVFNLMDKIISTLPSPMDAGIQRAVVDGEKVAVKPDVNDQTVVRIFKTVVDPYVGRLNYIKVISGKLKAGQTLKVSGWGEEKISGIYTVIGKKQEAVSELSAGDIGAVNKLNNTNTGDTLCDEVARIKFSAIPFPKPVLTMAISAAKSGEEDKVFQGLNRLAEEDLTFIVEKDKETNLQGFKKLKKKLKKIVKKATKIGKTVIKVADKVNKVINTAKKVAPIAAAVLA